MRRIIILGLFLCLGLLLAPAVAVAHDPISHLWEAIGEIRATLTSLDERVTALEGGTPEPTATPTPGVDIGATATPTVEPTPEGTYRGLTIAAEDRCTEYDRDDYSYPQSVEADIVAGMDGIIYGPYTGTHFASTDETDIEHIVATSEAHDSGMCDATDDEKGAFARDLLNLTLASPSVNRHQKAAKDAAEWLPTLNQCWYADRIVQVRVKYELTIDQAEADAIEDVLEDCESTEMIITTDPNATATPTPEATATPAPTPTPEPTAMATPEPSGTETIFTYGGEYVACNVAAQLSFSYPVSFLSSWSNEEPCVFDDGEPFKWLLYRTGAGGTVTWSVVSDHTVFLGAIRVRGSTEDDTYESETLASALDVNPSITFVQPAGSPAWTYSITVARTDGTTGTFTLSGSQSTDSSVNQSGLSHESDNYSEQVSQHLNAAER